MRNSRTQVFSLKFKSGSLGSIKKTAKMLTVASNVVYMSLFPTLSYIIELGPKSYETLILPSCLELQIEIKYNCPQLCNLGTRSEGTSPPGAPVTHTKWTWAEDQLKWVRTERLHGAIVPGPVAAQLWPNSRGLATAGGPTAQTTRQRAAGGALGQPQPSSSKFTEIWICF